jgi:hypothetical protein
LGLLSLGVFSLGLLLLPLPALTRCLPVLLPRTLLSALIAALLLLLPIACKVACNIFERFALLGCCVLEHLLRSLSHALRLLGVGGRLLPVRLAALPAPLAFAALKLTNLLRHFTHRLGAGQLIARRIFAWLLTVTLPLAALLPPRVTST